MTDVLVKPAFQSASTDLGVPGQLGPSEWNAARLFSGGNAGDIVVRDTGSATGAAWTATPTLSDLTLTSPSGMQANWYSYAAWGDSLTAGTGGTPYPTTLATLTGQAVFNGGVGGDTSTQIATRFLADSTHLGNFVIIWAGRNDFTTPATVKANIASMIAALPSPKRFLVLSVLNQDVAGEWSGGANYATLVQLNTDLAALYPNNYLDIRATLIAAFNPGIPQDVIDHGHDVSPSSLRSDAVHLNTAGYTLVANTVKAWLDAHDVSARIVARWSDLTTILTAPPPIGLSAGATIRLAGGTTAAPSLTFTPASNSGFAWTTSLYLSISGVPRTRWTSTAMTLGATQALSWSANDVDLTGADTTLARGAAGVVAVTSAFRFPEIADPSAPATNNAIFYAKDNGAGKTQLVVRFPTGAVQVIATEP